jgi:N-acetylglucosamine transport system substrate-binding protein
MDADRFAILARLARAERLDRRGLLRRGAAVGLSAPALAAVAAATAPATRALAQTPAAAAANPLGVDPAQPLDVLMWDVGWGDEYALNAIEIYKRLYPGVEVEYLGVQRMQEVAQPRFVSGDPPDVIEASQLDRPALAAEDLLADLSDLLAAPAFDTEGATLGETLRPGTQVDAVLDGVRYAVNFSYGVQGVWYDANLMEENGWTYPETWEGMLTLSEEIKGSGVAAPWTYQGQYPVYMSTVLWEMIWKHGGMEAFLAIDNLQPDAWRQDAVRAAVDAVSQLAQRDLIMPGTEALSHTDSQAQWLQRRAVFIPCGSWLENEMKDLIPADFAMTFAPVPSLEGDVVPFQGISTFFGQPFVVPAQAANLAGGKEFIRLLCSKENANFFSEYTHSLTTILGAGEGMDYGPAFNSALAALEAAGDNTFPGALYPSWYKPLGDEEAIQMGSLLTGQITPDEYIDNVQAMADQIAGDDSIPKFTREA